MPHQSLTIAIARALTGGAQDLPAIASRLATTLGRPETVWLEEFAQRYLRAFRGRARPRERAVVRFVVSDSQWSLRTAPTLKEKRQLRLAAWPLQPAIMQPASTATVWPVQPIEDVAALADWLDVASAELEWFADEKGLSYRQFGTRLHHYHYKVLQKRSGGIRIIEAPQVRLKSIQRKILSGILEKIPLYYSAAHGFVKGRSVRSFAQPHVGKPAVLCLDLQNFFPTIGKARVQALFRTMGYPERVADILGALCTNRTPTRVFAVPPRTASDVKEQQDARNLYGYSHLPQGAPTSPLIANLCAYRMDCRLVGLADWAGGVYTRYADDLAMSGGEHFARNIERYAAQVGAIALEEGWSVQHHKTRIMRQSGRQHLAGVVVNANLNVPRETFDQLKAILTNCIRHGPASQNRDAHPDFRSHLRGRVAWVASVNQGRGKRLESLFERIDWK